MPLDAGLLRIVARELLDLDIDEADAVACQGALVALQESVAQLARVPLPFDEVPFTEPAHGMRWIEDWGTAEVTP